MYDFFYKKVLAEGATKDYNAFEDNRKRVLTNARNRAKSAYQTYSAQLKQQKQKDYEDNVDLIINFRDTG